VSSPLGTDPSIALGTYEVTLLELTSAYAAFAQGATPVTPHGLPGAQAASATPIDPDLRAMMLDMLWQVVDRGTGRGARLGDMPAFGKTGTTQEHRDALFVGMAGDLVVGIWVGNDDGTPMKRVTGGSLPARMWRDFMKGAVRIAPSAGPLLRPQRALPPPVAMPDDSMVGGEGEVLPEPVEDVSELPPDAADMPVEVIDVPVPAAPLPMPSTPVPPQPQPRPTQQQEPAPGSAPPPAEPAPEPAPVQDGGQAPLSAPAA
jgi:penicillin-binding protein 1A